MKTLQSDLEALLNELGLTEELKLYRLQRDFKTLFKAPLSDHTYPVGLKKGVLTLVVDSNEWLFELKLNEQRLKNRLKDYKVHSIRFRLGRIPRKQRTAGQSTDKYTPLLPLPEELRNTLSEKIKDPELRQLIEVTIKKSLSKNPHTQ